MPALPLDKRLVGLHMSVARDIRHLLRTIGPNGWMVFLAGLAIALGSLVALYV